MNESDELVSADVQKEKRRSVCVSTYDQDVVELLHAVDLGQQLVDHGVVDSRAARHAATLFADRVDLIEDDDVKAAVCTELRDDEGEE